MTEDNASETQSVQPGLVVHQGEGICKDRVKVVVGRGPAEQHVVGIRRQLKQCHYFEGLNLVASETDIPQPFSLALLLLLRSVRNVVQVT